MTLKPGEWTKFSGGGSNCVEVMRTDDEVLVPGLVDDATIEAIANILVPDTLTVTLGDASGFLNGRRLADDVIDVTGIKVKSGKSPGTDLREGVPTLPVLLLRQAAAAGDDSAQPTPAQEARV